MRAPRETDPGSGEPAGAAFRRRLRALVQLLRPSLPRLLAVAALGPLVGLLTLIPPYLNKLLFDQVGPGTDLGWVRTLVLAGLAIVTTHLLAEAAISYVSARLNAKLEASLVLHTFNHLQHLPAPFFRHRRTGELLSRLEDLKGALGLVSGGLSLLFGRGISLLAVPVALAALSTPLAALALVLAPLPALLPVLASRRVRQAWSDLAHVHAEVQAHQLEALQQLPTRRALGLEHATYRTAAEQWRGVLDRQLRAQGLEQTVRTGERLLDALQLGLFAWLGWQRIVAGTLSLGDYVAFLSYLTFLRTPFVELVAFLASLQRWRVQLERAFELLEAVPEQDPVDALTPPGPIRQPLLGALRCEGLRFAYDAEEPVLHGLDLQVPVGTSCAVVGGSGSGKTTLARLLIGAERPTGGRVLLDGHDLAALDLREVRRQLGVVWQEPILFHGTVGDNLSIGLERVGREELDEVIGLCALDAWLASLPHGYDTPVAELGASLSGGERQRLALARALLREPRVLVLDEVTSQLDVATERRVLAAVLARAREHGQTVLLITHRLANAPLVDRVIVLERGQLIAEGHHGALLRSSPTYRRWARLAGLEDAVEGAEAMRVAR